MQHENVKITFFILKLQLKCSRIIAVEVDVMKVKDVKFSLKAARLYRNFTQKELAKRLEVSVSTYIKYETNPEKLTVQVIKKISIVLNLPISSFNFFNT